MLRRFAISLLMATTIASFGGFAVAQMKVPATSEDHTALAKQYKDKADGHRKEASEHRAMAAAYKDSAANAQDKGRGQKNPAVVKMEKHCNAIATAAEKLATENEKASDYHTLRAKELQGK